MSKRVKPHDALGSTLIPEPSVPSPKPLEDPKEALSDAECPMGWERFGNVSWFQDQAFNPNRVYR